MRRADTLAVRDRAAPPEGARPASPAAGRRDCARWSTSSRRAASACWRSAPGGGALTGELLAAGARVLAWELDLGVGRGPARAPRGSGPASVVGDALDLPWERLPAPTLVAGNLPYGVATALIDRVLDQGPRRVPRAAFLVQLEVAQRLAARPGTSDYGALSVLDRGARRAAAPRPRAPRQLPARRPRCTAPSSASSCATPPLPPRPRCRRSRPPSTPPSRSGARRCATRSPRRWGRARPRPRSAAAGIEPDRRAQELALADFLRLHAAAPRSFS